MTIIERLQQNKELEPHKIALIVDDIQYTYGELYDAILSVGINNTSRIVNLTQSRQKHPRTIIPTYRQQITSYFHKKSILRK